MKTRALVVAVALALSCSGRHVQAPSAHPGPALLELHVDVRDPHAVRATAHFVRGASAKIALPDETLHGLSSIEIQRDGKWIALDRAKLEAPECVNDCTLRYAIDLERVERSFEGVVAVGEDAFVAPSPSWMAHPDPLPKGLFEMTIDGATDANAAFTSIPFATGLRRKDTTHFALDTYDYWEGSFAAFGHLRHRLVEAAGAKIEIVLVSDTKLALSDDEIATWVKDDAECVAQIYGHFPVDRASVFLVPIDGAGEVVFGKVLSLGGSSVIALTGTRFTKDETHHDWVLVHEMTHLGFPTIGNVRWLTEGLATYYEPILRTRKGWRTPASLWDALAHSMKRGIPREGAELALDKRDSIDDSYWGGAIFMLLADVGIRRATGNKKSFDDVLRLIVSQGGDATVVWTLPEVIAAAKKATGTNVVADLVERLAVRGEKLDMDALWHDLGVVRSPHPALDDTAKDAAIRRAIDGSDH
jgi:hypothetical protein